MIDLGKCKVSRNQLKINNLLKDEFVVIKKVIESEPPENTELQLIGQSAEDCKRITAMLNDSYNSKNICNYFGKYFLYFIYNKLSKNGNML